MMKVVTINGRLEYIFSNEDMFRLIQERMGEDFEAVLRTSVADLQEQADYTKARLKTDLEGYEGQYDSDTCAFNDIWDEMQVLSTINDSKRISRDKIQVVINKIRKICENQR